MEPQQEQLMPGTVTIGLPIYKRLEHLPRILENVADQDYPHIELLVSDNGCNGSRVRELVEAHYRRPFRFRQNDATVDINTHFNQLVEEALGEYFVLLCDDDEISSNYVSELVGVLERHTDADVAFAHQEAMDEQGRTCITSVEDLPEVLPGEQFLKMRAQYKSTGIRNMVTHLSRTAALRRCGGWPRFPRSLYSDEALAMKLGVDRPVGFSRRCTFRHRFYAESYGVSSSCWDLAAASRQFMKFLAVEPELVAFAKANPKGYRALHRIWSTELWHQYYRVWRTRYRCSMSLGEWVRAAFVMPPIAGYYARVAWPLVRYTVPPIARSMFPRAYAFCLHFKRS